MRPRAAVCALRLVDPERRRIFSARHWLYAVELSRLLTDLGYETVWYQLGTGWRSEVTTNVPLVGVLPERSQLGFWPEASSSFWEKSGGAELAIYFDARLAYPQTHEASIAIAHGIDWNDPLLEVRLETDREREEWRRRFWMALQGPQNVVAVDTGFIQWATATWPGLYNTFVHIPDFAAPCPGGEGAGEAGDPQGTGGSAIFPESKATSGSGDPPDSITPREPKPAESGQPVRILFWDALTPRSGIAQTLQAIEPLLKAFPEIEFVIAGSAAPETNEFLTRWAEVHPRTTFVPGELPAGSLRGVSILLMPGKWGTGATHLCLQGMAAGAAVLVGQSSGLTDLVIHDYNGRVIQGTAEAIRDSVERLILDSDARRRMGERAREVAAHFTLERWRERWVRVMESVHRGGRSL